MKTILALPVLLLLFSCKKENHLQNPVNDVNRKQIAAWYNDVNDITKMTSDSISYYAAQMERAAIHEPNEYKAMALFMKGASASNDAAYELSRKYYESALLLLQKSKADTLRAKVYNGIGSNYKNTGDYSKAFANLYRALKIYEKHHDNEGICNVQGLLGEVYFQKGNIKAAKERFLTALHALKDDQSNVMYLTAAHNLANVYGISGDFESALKIDTKGIRISDSIHSPKTKVTFLDNKANCFMYSNRLDSAQYYFEQCLKIDTANGNKKQIADSYSNLGQLYIFKKEYGKAEQQIQQSISILKSIDGKPNLAKAYPVLAAIYMQQGKYKKALEASEAQYANYKKMIDEKEAAALSEFRVVYETQKKESEIQSLLQERKIRSLKIKEQKLQIEKRNYLIAAFLLLVIGLISIGYFRKRQQQLKDLLAREKTIRETEEHERIRIAKDIHDDLGSGLTKINFLSEIILRKSEELPEIRSSSESVKETAAKLIDNMRDLIWAMNPDNITLANLIARMREYTTDYLEDYPIALRYDFPSDIPNTEITKESHRELFMLVKETLNNIVRHAEASEVHFGISLTSEKFTLSIKDNGSGFEKDSIKTGNGLRNMQSRLAAIGGIWNITSGKGQGTHVKAEVLRSEILKSD